jgi:hypothetical protein
MLTLAHWRERGMADHDRKLLEAFRLKGVESNSAH